MAKSEKKAAEQMFRDFFTWGLNLGYSDTIVNLEHHQKGQSVSRSPAYSKGIFPRSMKSELNAYKAFQSHLNP